MQYLEYQTSPSCSDLKNNIRSRILQMISWTIKQFTPNFEGSRAKKGALEVIEGILVSNFAFKFAFSKIEFNEYRCHCQIRFSHSKKKQRGHSITNCNDRRMLWPRRCTLFFICHQFSFSLQRIFIPFDHRFICSSSKSKPKKKNQKKNRNILSQNHTHNQVEDVKYHLYQNYQIIIIIITMTAPRAQY